MSVMSMLTFAEENAFSFVCPIFNVETKIADCIKLRDAVWRGRQLSVRRGCQACMASSKCPAAAIVQRIAMTRGPHADDYGSPTPVTGKLRADILERILPVVVRQPHLDQLAVPAVEVQLIESANERIQAQLGRAPAASTGRVTTGKSRSRPEAAKQAKPETSQALNSAAASGDLSAAINTGDAS